MLYNGHSSSEQLDQLSRQPAGSGEPWAHIENCVQCKTTLEKYRKLNLKLDQLAANGIRSTSTMNCPDESVWLEVAAGTLSPEENLSYSSHAATCDACAKKLQAAARIFEPEVTEEEERILDSLPSFYQEASARLAKENVLPVKPVKPPKSDKLRRSFWRPFSYGFSGIAALIIVGFLSLGLITDNLLAKGYTQKGTLEYRIAKASPPKEGTRGPGISRERPTSLVLADLLIKFRLALSPQNPRWLGEKGRLELIEGDESSAVNTLEQAHALDSRSKHIAIDLASAYARTGSKDLLFKAEELLLSILPLEKDNPEVLRSDPDDLEALYNLAIVYEVASSLKQAQDTWDRYLRLDSSSAWAEGARRRQKDLNEKRQFMSAPRANSSVEEWIAFLETEDLNAAEQALDAGLHNWMINRTGLTPHLDHLLSLLSTKLRKEHGEYWLADILQMPLSKDADNAFRALQNAIQLNSSADFEKAILAARDAQSLFQRAGNTAGLARAQLEEIYSHQRSTDAGVCLQSADQLESRILSKDYPWLKAQLYLDRASCMNMLGLRQQGQEQANQALTMATRSKYNILRLRALGIAASQATTQGDHPAALVKDVYGLEEYWSAAYPAERAYQFDSDIIFNAEALKLWNVVYDTGLEAARIISKSAHKELEAVIRYRIAEAAVMLGKHDTAYREVEQANRLFSSLPQSRTIFIYKVDGILTLAKAEIETEHSDHAVALLEQSAGEFPPGESHIIANRLYQVRGAIAYKAGRLKDARLAYAAAVVVAEIALSDLRTPLARVRWSLQNIVSYKTLVQIVLDSGDSQRAFEIWEAYKTALIRDKLSVPVPELPRFYGSELHDVELPNFVRIEDLRSELKPAEVLISYAFLPNGLTAWVLDENGLYTTVLPGAPDDLRRSFHQFDIECGNPSSDLKQLQSHAKGLYRLLLSPFANRLSVAKTLIIEADDDLEAVPFQALIDGTDKYLEQSLSVVSSPGVIFRKYLRPIQTITTRDKAVLVGSPDISSKWKNILPSLPSAKAEVELVATRFDNPLSLTGSNASYRAVRNGITNANVFHFAGHSIASRFGPALVLTPSSARSNDDLLTVASIPPDALQRLKLVVLSACNPRGFKSAGIEQLTQPFLYAGVPEIIVSRWQIDSSTTALLMKKFYDEILVRNAPNSLRLAAVQILQNPGTEHPYYWAAFTLVGA